MANRDQVIAEARMWIGTPYHHQASLKGIGVDCGGLICGVGVATGLIPLNYRSLPDVAPFAVYPRRPQGNSMAEACRVMLDEIPLSAAQIADVYLMRFGRDPQHVALLTDKGILHTHSQVGRVVEQTLETTWRRRIVAAYRYRGIE